MIAILHIRELCSLAIYFYLTLLSLFAQKNIFRGKYHTCEIIRIWAIEIPSLTHHDIMVDTEKMVLAGPCNPKFHYQHHYLLWMPTQKSWIVHNATLKKFCSRNYWVGWQPSWILTDLLKSKLFPKCFIKIHHSKNICLEVYLVNPGQLEAQFGKYVIWAFHHFLSQSLGNGLWETMSAKNLTVDIILCYEES